MKIARRFVRDESGMTLALAIMMIVLIGVMGAGLLAFANRDLNTVVEENKGQKAFEMADAGVNAARRQLASDCANNTGCKTNYDDPDPTSPFSGAEDKIWSKAKGGLTLNNLDGLPGTPDSVNVKINAETGAYAFKIVSTGYYGNATKRKIEAKLNGIPEEAKNITYSAAYSPSTVEITGNNVNLKGISLFSEKNIIINGLTTQADFKNEYDGTLVKNGPDIFTTQKSPEDLYDWDSTNVQKFGAAAGNYNTIPRRTANGSTFSQVGFAAQNLICGATANVPACAGPSNSIADGRYGYDSTTGSTVQHPGSQGLQFVNKQPEDVPNAPNTITYPFPREPRPSGKNLKQSAITSNSYVKLPVGQQPDWNTLVPNGQNKRVLFIDAQNQNITYNRNDKNNQFNGIIVVWCGNLTMTNSNFGGVIITMNGSGASLPPDTAKGETSSTSCGSDQGKFTVTNSTLTAWIYAMGGNDTTPGLTIGDSTALSFVPSGQTDLLGIVYKNPFPVSFAVRGWRELYSDP